MIIKKALGAFLISIPLVAMMTPVFLVGGIGPVLLIVGISGCAIACIHGGVLLLMSKK